MKQHTRNRNRRMTRAQKRMVSAAGVDAAQYLFAGENDFYLFLVHKHTDERISVPKSRKTK